ncbi:hypothetical protein AYO22_01751 [Fonsecaea multimorphosa]|nr:hypothetical protein AYO22_01751 [Fonsecaea multimorphosa]
MRAFTLGLSTVAALVAFSNLVAAQAEPEITEPAVLPTSEDEVHAFTPELTPDDEYFVDESEGARLAKRTPPAGVYICNNKSWLAPCTWTKLVDSQCMSFPSDAGSSVGVSGLALSSSNNSPSVAIRVTFADPSFSLAASYWLAV